MKITQEQIRQLIKEELEKILLEGEIVDYEQQRCDDQLKLCGETNQECIKKWLDCKSKIKDVAIPNLLKRKESALSKFQDLKKQKQIFLANQLSQEIQKLKKQKADLDRETAAELFKKIQMLKSSFAKAKEEEKKAEEEKRKAEEEARKRREKEEKKNKKFLDLYLKVLIAVANKDSLDPVFEIELKEIFGRELIQQAIRKGFIEDNYEGGFYLGSEEPVGFDTVREKLEDLHNNLSELEDWYREGEEYSYEDLLEKAKGDDETVALFIDLGLVEKAEYDSYVFNDYEKELAYQLQLFDEEE